MYLIYNNFFNVKNKIYWKRSITDRLFSVIFYSLILFCVLFINKCNAQTAEDKNLNVQVAVCLYMINLFYDDICYISKRKILTDG